ncbi:MAG: pyridoxamine 5'-phosphate oxidase family protein [Nitrospinae bacterium]|nr:pyridoxamine 5'-phosphate oxidase family protein [Nitrospinota bacterium]MBL7019664.1 pyridoxamine 5'-phosphate oxidase family protein [Nitrospinaceae bacterium]
MKKPGSKGEHDLQKKLATEKRALAFYNSQLLNHLNPEMRQFIAEQEMVFISTSDSKGECDASFRAGHTGFVTVLNEKTLLFPEYRGNGVLASMGNISENPHIGMFFVDFYQSSIGLHVNGKAGILSNEDLAADLDLSGKIKWPPEKLGSRKPASWIKVEVEEAYIHCSKHIPLMQKKDKTIHWETDDEKLKGGDFFNAKSRTEPDGK